MGRFWEGLGRVLGRFLKLFDWIWGDEHIRATKGKSMDGWRSTNHWNHGWMVCRGPKMLALRWEPFFREALFLDLFLERVFFRFFSMLGGFWEVLGVQNGGQNRFLGGFFAMLFSTAFWYRFWVVF